MTRLIPYALAIVLIAPIGGWLLFHSGEWLITRTGSVTIGAGIPFAVLIAIGAAVVFWPVRERGRK